MPVSLKTAESGIPLSASGPHQDEFPAVYSSAGCSSAEPASASTAVPIFNPKPRFAQQFPANGNRPRILLSQSATQASAVAVTVRGTDWKLVVGWGGRVEEPCTLEIKSGLR